jgi:hypothetical protein
MRTMGNENIQTGLGNEINWALFENKGGDGDFLKFKDNETHLIGIKEIKPGVGKFMRKQADGTEKEVEVPQVYLMLDFVDKPIDTPMVFGTSAKYLISIIRKYHESRMLYKWIFEIQRKGTEKMTKYTIIPTKERAVGATPLKSEQVVGFI